MLQPLLQAKQHAHNKMLQHCEQERVRIVKHSVEFAKICKVAEEAESQREMAGVDG